MLYKDWLNSNDAEKSTFVSRKASEYNITENEVLRSIQNECSFLREVEYAPLKKQLEMQYDDSVNGTTTWTDHINDVKTRYPKPS